MHISIMLVFWSLVRNSVVLAVYFLFSVTCFFTVHEHSKIDVNGENADPLYKWLTSETVFTGFEGEMGDILDPIVVKMDPDYKTNGNIKWNFTKFLIGKDGNIVERFEPTASLERVKASIEKLL